MTALLVLGLRDSSTLRLGQPVGPTVGDEQQHAYHQERDDDEPYLVPTALMCKDHPDDRTV